MLGNLLDHALWPHGGGIGLDQGPEFLTPLTDDSCHLVEHVLSGPDWLQDADKPVQGNLGVALERRLWRGSFDPVPRALCLSARLGTPAGGTRHSHVAIPPRRVPMAMTRSAEDTMRLALQWEYRPTTPTLSGWSAARVILPFRVVATGMVSISASWATSGQAPEAMTPEPEMMTGRRAWDISRAASLTWSMLGSGRKARVSRMTLFDDEVQVGLGVQGLVSNVQMHRPRRAGGGLSEGLS